MHGVTSPETLDHELYDTPPHRAGPAGLLWRARYFLLVVVLPTLLVALYVCVVASRQYVSEAHFVVRAAGAGQSAGQGIGQLLGMGNGLPPAQAESLALGDYLTSHDAVAMLDGRLDLRRLFRRPGTDALSRLWADATPETLLKYYRGQVKLKFDDQTGITTMRVSAFTPEDSFRIASLLLAAGERRVNGLNRRAYADAVAVATQQLEAAQQELTGRQRAITRLRQGVHDIDPIRTGDARIQLRAALEGRLVSARAQLAAMRGAILPTSPQYVTARRQVAALAAQVAAEDARLAGGAGSLAAGLGDYEELRMRQDFASKRYAAAAAALESARQEAIRQQLFVVRVVEPNLPVKSLYPERLRIVGSVFVALLLAYAIGWLIVAGVREHAA